MESEYLKHIEAVDSMELYSIMTQYGDDVFRYAYTITKNRERAKDVAQEVFIKAYSKLHSFRGQSSFKTWLFAITRNIALNELKSSYIRRVLLLEKVRAGEAVQSAESAYIAQQSVEDLWAIIMSLSYKLREVLVLDLEHKLTIQETARLLNISEGTVKSRLHRARKAVEIKWKELEQ